MSSFRPVLERLRVATASHHQALEENLQAVERLSTRSGRRLLLEKYYRMHASADFALARWLEPVDGLNIEHRRRTPILVHDLCAHGLLVPSSASLPDVSIESRGEALGFLYVLEGSSLGGRMIHKAITAKGCDLVGLGFLDPYGDETGATWRTFLEILERDGGDDLGGVERGGVKGFQHAHNCLLNAEIAS